MFTLTHQPDTIIASSFDGFLAIVQFEFDPLSRFVLKPDSAAVVVRVEINRNETARFDELSPTIPVGDSNFHLSQNGHILFRLTDFSPAEGIAEHAVDEASTITILTGRRTSNSWLSYNSPNVLEFGRTIADAQGHYFWNADLTLGGMGAAPLSYRRTVYDYRRSTYGRLFALGPSCRGGASIFQFFVDAGAQMQVQNGQLVRTATNPLPRIIFTDRRRGDQQNVFFGVDPEGMAHALGAEGAAFVLGGSFTTLPPAAIQMLVSAALSGNLVDALEHPSLKLGPDTVASTVFPLSSVEKKQTPRPPLLEGVYLRQLPFRSQPAVFL
ncbi:hypothetical protein ACVWWG_007980 [Bradyrhizobium sp. LB7.2]